MSFGRWRRARGLPDWPAGVQPMPDGLTAEARVIRAKRLFAQRILACAPCRDGCGTTVLTTPFTRVDSFGNPYCPGCAKAHPMYAENANAA